MFEFLGSILDTLIMVALGLIAFLRPCHIASKKGTADQIRKRVRWMKRAGATLIVCGVGLFVLKLVA